MVPYCKRLYLCLYSCNFISRFTTFELVHDNIIATLIADYAATALMKEGCVKAVVVGVDRVATNGSNKTI